MYQDTAERCEQKHSRVTVQNGSEKDSPGVHRESIGIKLYQCVWNHGLRWPCPFYVSHPQINVVSKGK